MSIRVIRNHVYHSQLVNELMHLLVIVVVDGVVGALTIAKPFVEGHDIGRSKVTETIQLTECLHSIDDDLFMCTSSVGIVRLIQGVLHEPNERLVLVVTIVFVLRVLKCMDFYLLVIIDVEVLQVYLIPKSDQSVKDSLAVFNLV